ncbi:APC family permease [Emergencia sp.]|uniref:APC family permease n=1 Tax=Emergencia sp. TaxID=1926557 RepID=UPI003AEF5757
MSNGLRKELKLSSMIAMAAGGMIAAWMVEIKYWFELSGPGAAFSLMTCGILILPLCFIYSEMTSMMPYAGGQNIWITNAFGRNTGFASCWLIMLLYVMAMPTVAYGIASMLGYLFPVTSLQIKIIASVILVIWFFLTNRELKVLAKLQNILFWSTLVVSICASTIFIFSGHWHFSSIEWFPNGFSGYTAAIGLLIMKFVGFDLIPQLSEEAKFPKKDLWKAFVGALGCTVLIYSMAVIAVGGIVSNDWVAQTDIVDPRVADIIDMHWLGLIIVVMGSLTCITTLSSFWLSASRILYGASKQRQMTSKFGELNKFGQPQFANIIVGILSIYFTVFAPDAWVDYIYTIYGVAAGAVYLMVALSFLKLRKVHPEWPRPYKVKAGTLMGIIGIIFCLWVLYSSITAMNKGAWLVLALYGVLGVILWAYGKHKEKTDPLNWTPVILSPDTVDSSEDNEEQQA